MERDFKRILEELRDSLNREEIRTKNYIQGFSDAIGEAMYLIEKHATEYKKSEVSQ